MSDMLHQLVVISAKQHDPRKTPSRTTSLVETSSIDSCKKPLADSVRLSLGASSISILIRNRPLARDSS